MTVEWISEGDRLPRVGQDVLLARPHQSGEFWDICVAVLLIRHEGVVPRPVLAGSPRPVDYYWRCGRFAADSALVTGNNWWASLKSLPLPPNARHEVVGRYDVIRQIKEPSL